VGELSAEQLSQLRNAAGRSYLEAGKEYGVDPDRLKADRLDPKRYVGLIEVHIEQGPGMWRRDQQLAVVRAIAGRRQYRVSISGEANHAGATSMADRRDALAAAAEMLVALERLPRALSPDAVLTVGRLVNAPNAVNVIPDRVEFTIDFRSGDDATLARGDGEIRAALAAIASPRSVTTTVEQTEAIAARPMDAKLVERLAQAAGTLNTVVSGALHDSAVLAPFVPTAMLFVPSRDGISHNPAEFSRVEDIAAAATAVWRVVRRVTVAQLNAMGREAFVSVCGRAFEHSPWIAERTWQTGRPFASRADLHEKLCATLAHATDDEKLALIRAHPDLVGRLAREGRLTRESTGEQAAAGLDALSDDEIAAFEAYNAQYRERFGFPFVICAREHRKEAILAAFPVRLKNTAQQETATAIAEIEKIARLRLMDATWDD
jgi:OHCU decarboxylase